MLLGFFLIPRFRKSRVGEPLPAEGISTLDNFEKSLKDRKNPSKGTEKHLGPISKIPYSHTHTHTNKVARRMRRTHSLLRGG